MKSDIRVCNAWRDRHDHSVYSFPETYLECGATTESSAPASYNLEDPYGEYRHVWKRRLAEEPEQFPPSAIDALLTGAAATMCVNNVEIEAVEEVDLTNPVLVEGSSGVGNVGKLAVEHLLEELEGATLVCRVYTDAFPPQVSIDKGIAKPIHVAIHAVGTPDEKPDLSLLMGDYQTQPNESHYCLTDTFLDIGEEFGVGCLFALGDISTSELVNEPSVLGAVVNESCLDGLDEVGIEFHESEPTGGAIGVFGLLSGPDGRCGLDATCLMGETSSYLTNPQSAQVIIEVLQDLLQFSVDSELPEGRAERMKEVAARIQETQQ